MELPNTFFKIIRKPTLTIITVKTILITLVILLSKIEQKTLVNEIKYELLYNFNVSHRWIIDFNRNNSIELTASYSYFLNIDDLRFGLGTVQMYPDTRGSLGIAHYDDNGFASELDRVDFYNYITSRSLDSINNIQENTIATLYQDVRFKFEISEFKARELIAVLNEADPLFTSTENLVIAIRSMPEFEMSLLDDSNTLLNISINNIDQMTTLENAFFEYTIEMLGGSPDFPN